MNDLSENEKWIKPADDPLPSVASYGSLFFGSFSIVSLITRNVTLLLISSSLCVFFVISYLGYRKSSRYFQVLVLKHIYRSGSTGGLEYQQLRRRFESESLNASRHILNQSLWFLQLQGMVEIYDDGRMISVVSEMVENSGLYKDLAEYI